MVKDDISDQPLEFRELNKALEADTTDERHRRRLQKLLKYKPLKAVFDESKACFGRSPSWEDHEHWFCHRVEYSKDISVRKLQHLLKFIEQEMDPLENPRAVKILGGEPTVPEHRLGGGDLPLLGMCEGERLLELNSGWKWSFGTLVGNGDGVRGGSPICEKYLNQMDPYLVRKALLGQDLVINKKDLAWAERLCERM